MPKIKYLTHSAKVVTDENWGSTLESNLQSIARAAGVCHHNTIPATERLISMAIKHPALLEHTNIERCAALNPPVETRSFRDWKEWVTGGNPLDVNLVGSWRDIYEIKGKDPEILRKYIAQNTERPTVLPRLHPMKRIQMVLTINGDISGKLRTERMLSELATSPSGSKLNWSIELPIVYDDLEFLKKIGGERWFLQALQTYNEILETNPNIEGYTVEEVKGRLKELAGHFLPKTRLAEKAITGSVKDFMAVVSKRNKETPYFKYNVFSVMAAISTAIEDYVSGKEGAK